MTERLPDAKAAMEPNLTPNPAMRAMLRKRRPPLSKYAKLALAYPATIGSRRRASLFDDVRVFGLFIGYSRSGHSLLAALLDAHPRIVMAHELGVLRYAYAGLGRAQLYDLLLQNTRIRGHSVGRGGGHTYDVAEGWQGRFDQIQAIGDKHGEFTARYLAQAPHALGRLRRVVGVPLRFIHMVRDPLDNIASRAIRAAEKHGGEPDIDAAIDDHAEACRAVQTVLAMLPPEEVLHTCHETFIEHPKQELGEACRWLGVEPETDYLEACAAKVEPSPHASRGKVSWTQPQQDRVRQLIASHAFLAPYA